MPSIRSISSVIKKNRTVWKLPVLQLQRPFRHEWHSLPERLRSWFHAEEEMHVPNEAKGFLTFVGLSRNTRLAILWLTREYWFFEKAMESTHLTPKSIPKGAR
jgi:hypothetical protein